MATALTGLSDETRDAIFFKSSLIAGVSKKFEVYVYQPRKASDPMRHPDVRAEVVYAMDRKRVLAADILFVMVDHPSLGVGQEIEIAAAFGTPSVLILHENARAKVSRMVIGSHLNLIGHVVYAGPEDLEAKIRSCLGENLTRIRSFRNAVKPAITETIGARLRQMRESVGFSLEQAASQIGASSRLLQDIEARALSYHNAGLHLVARLLTVYGKTALELFSGAESSSVQSEPRADFNIVRLEGVARRLGWSIPDFLDLREEYQRELAASGGSELITEDVWIQRQRALQSRRWKDSQARGSEPSEPTAQFSPRY